jgi:hypothetical protein
MNRLLMKKAQITFTNALKNPQVKATLEKQKTHHFFAGGIT